MHIYFIYIIYILYMYVFLSCIPYVFQFKFLINQNLFVCNKKNVIAFKIFTLVYIKCVKTSVFISA